VREGQRGFTVVEVLLALAIALPVAVALLGIVRLALGGTQAAASNAAAAAVMDDLVERLDAESHGAAALFEPATDVLGSPSCDPHGECRELDFFTRDAQGAAHFWAYRFDPQAHTLQRYLYDDLGASGPVNLRASGSALPLQSFEVKHVPISRVHVAALGNYAPKDVAVALGYAGVNGGNALAVVNLSNAAFHLKRELLPRLAASGFTVVVGTYTPGPRLSPSPMPTALGKGLARNYISHLFWRIGPCVNVPPKDNCGPGSEGQLEEQEGDSYGPGGNLSAPPGSQIPVADVCQTPGDPPNPNAQSPQGEYDAAATLYGGVTDPLTGVSEAWYVPPPGGVGDYDVPQPPLTGAKPGQANPFAPQIENGPGYSYDTIFVVGC
jgi:type II secretory pathway pseudopilin PulG